MQRYGVIMAGGGGTRFWPLSRQQTPKQLLNLTGRAPMICETFDRMARVIDPDHIYIVTSAVQADGILSALSGRTSRTRLLVEPEPRDTAACIGYAATVITARHGDSLMLVTPSDHYIRDAERLAQVWETALAAAADGDSLVTVGIRPDRPATAYGYIHYDTESRAPVRKVFSFHEKPDPDTAGRYLAEGDYAWNSGMFIWRTDAILKRLQQHAPDIAAHLAGIRQAVNTPHEQDVIADSFRQMRRISVDYAVMEPCAADGGVLLVPGDFGWNDVGSWDMMDALHEADADSNILLGDAQALNSRDCVIVAKDRFVSAVDVEGLVIIQTPDAVMVCRKDRAQNVKQVVEALQAAGRTDLL